MFPAPLRGPALFQIDDGQGASRVFTLGTLKNQGIYSEGARVSHPDSLYLPLAVIRLHITEILLNGR